VPIQHTETRRLVQENELHSAAHYSKQEIVEKLLAQGASLDKQHTERGGLPIHWATEGTVAICNLLLDAGADVNAIAETNDERDGMTPLIYCAWWCGDCDDCIAIAINLIERGADLQARDAEGKTAVDRAKQQGHLKMARALTEKGCS